MPGRLAVLVLVHNSFAVRTRRYGRRVCGYATRTGTKGYRDVRYARAANGLPPSSSSSTVASSDVR
eukprot:scaffold225833_cov19-Prasinocladus_malaysianus.AAC.3